MIISEMIKTLELTKSSMHLEWVLLSLRVSSKNFLIIVFDEMAEKALIAAE